MYTVVTFFRGQAQYTFNCCWISALPRLDLEFVIQRYMYNLTEIETLWFTYYKLANKWYTKFE